MAESRLTWGGNQAAQKEADDAFKRLRNKSKKKPNAKQRKASKRHSGESRRPHEFIVTDSATYGKYLESKHWRRRRKQAIAAAGTKCERCQSGLNLHVHHRSYKRLWREKKTDLEVLCSSCHDAHHRAEHWGLTVDAVHEMDTAREIAVFL